jgi:hypothetical protein
MALPTDTRCDLIPGAYSSTPAFALGILFRQGILRVVFHVVSVIDYVLGTSRLQPVTVDTSSAKGLQEQKWSRGAVDNKEGEAYA